MPYTAPPDYTPTIEQVFTYIAPTIPEQQQKHTALNEAAKRFAFEVNAQVTNTEYKKQILLLLQQASLLGHQSLTIEYQTPNK